MKTLVAGAGGLLGGAFLQALAGEELVAAGRDVLDVRRPQRVAALVEEHAPALVINCAAHTDVEAAEREPDIAFAANAILPGLLAAACRRTGAVLVQISSTGCYGADKDTPYTEEDAVAPTTAHHRAKVSGERAVVASGCEHLIVRTGWLFGGAAAQPKNFVWKRILEARAAPEMFSDAVQRGNPTYVGDVAAQTLALVRLRLTGLYNVVARGPATRHAYVTRIVQTAGLACTVRPGPAFKRLAAVSPNESAANYRLDLMGLDQMPSWTDSLDRYVEQLLREEAGDGPPSPRSGLRA